MLFFLFNFAKATMPSVQGSFALENVQLVYLLMATMCHRESFQTTVKPRLLPEEIVAILLQRR